MKSFYIVKKNVETNILNPKVKISNEEFMSFINDNDKFTWLENTHHGIKANKIRSIKKNIRAYLNYNREDEKNFIHLMLYVKKGYIKAQFDYRITYENLMDLIYLSEKINCNVWQNQPKKLIIDESFAKKYKKSNSTGVEGSKNTPQ